MSKKSLFLDTNIYIGYALDSQYERYHPQCCHVFDKARLHRHTSYTVRGELHKKMNERKALYRELLKYCLSGKQLRQFNIKKLDRNEQGHALDVITASHKSGKSDVEYVRSLDRLFFARVNQALLKRTEDPLVPYSLDAQLKSDFGLLSIHSPDDSILADFFSWALPGTGSIFLTGDGRLYRARSTILGAVGANKMTSCGHLAIEHIVDAIRNYP